MGREEEQGECEWQGVPDPWYDPCVKKWTK